ncbi:MAG: universal stress protein [Thermodesulfobacteriota bacterium]|nr:universal stress protein [Thermodesulfobacteriota bacterium]
MEKVNEILYATDLSATAKEAMSWTKSLADKYDAKITIVHIIPDLVEEINTFGTNRSFGTDRSKPSIGQERDDAIASKQEEILQLCKERLKDQPDCKIDLDHILVKVGKPVQEILKTVDSGKFDILIMGTHSKGLLSKVLLGSVAKGVVEQCSVPVLTVRLSSD